MSSLAPHRCSSLVRAMRPFLRPGLRLFQGTARRGRQGWPSRLAHLWLGISRPRLGGPSTVPRSRRSGRHRTCPHTFEFALLVENRPGDASKLVGERDRQHIVVQSFLGGIDPGLETVAVPVLYPDQDDPGCLHEQRTQVAITVPRYRTEDRAVSCRDLPGHQSWIGTEVASVGTSHRCRSRRPSRSR